MPILCYGPPYVQPGVFFGMSVLIRIRRLCVSTDIPSASPCPKNMRPISIVHQLVIWLTPSFVYPSDLGMSSCPRRLCVSFSSCGYLRSADYVSPSLVCPVALCRLPLVWSVFSVQLSYTSMCLSMCFICSHTFQRDIRDCNVLCFTETRLTRETLSESVRPAGFFTHCADRNKHLSGKKRGMPYD